MTRPPRGLRSFSLVELLVSISILSILILVLFGMLQSLTTAWQQGQAHNERRTVALDALDSISRDLSQAALPTTKTATNSLEMVINPSGVSTAYQYPQSMFWQAPVATDGGTNGDLAVVGYFVQWVPGATSPGTPCLSRVVINPSASDYAVYTSPNSWISDTLLAKYASSAVANNYAGLLAPNVIGLWIQVLDPNGTPIQQGISPSLNGEAFDSRFPYSYLNLAGNVVTDTASAFPAQVQVAIAVIDSRTARRLANTGKPTYPPLTGNFWTDIQNFYQGLPLVIRQGTEIQTTMVTLPNAPR